MPVIKIKVEGKIAKNLTPEVKIVCGNEDYTVEFEFDSTWQEENVKTGIVAFNGVAIPVPFKGNKLELPKLKKTNLCGIGVKTDDGKLQTTTPAYVECLYSAEDLTDEEIPAPTKDVYDQIIELINKTIIEANIPYDGLPLMDGVAQAGESNNFARGDHRHPTDENLKVIAENAEKIAQSAQENLNLSVEKAESALEKATLANETANSAKELSQTASENAQQALNTANNIDEVASSALNLANSAFERASEIGVVANEAKSTAESAKETAQNASSQVGVANENANLALNTATEAKSLIEGASDKANKALEQSNELKLQIPYFGTTLEMVLDQSTYVLTAKLFNKDGVALSTQTVDLPLETMVVSGRYDYVTKQIILTLKNGETISLPVVDLIGGLVSQDRLDVLMSQKVDKVPIANQLLGTDNSGNPTSYPLDSVGTKVLVNGEKVTEFDADTKLDKLAGSGNVLYARQGGETKGITYGYGANAYTMAYRDANGNFQVNAPVAEKDCVPNDYLQENYVAISTEQQTGSGGAYAPWVYTNDTTAKHYLAASDKLYTTYNIPMIYGEMAGGNSVRGYLLTGTPQRNYQAANKKYVDETSLSVANQAITDWSIENHFSFVATGIEFYFQPTSGHSVLDLNAELNPDAPNGGYTLAEYLELNYAKKGEGGGGSSSSLGEYVSVDDFIENIDDYYDYGTFVRVVPNSYDNLSSLLLEEIARIKGDIILSPYTLGFSADTPAFLISCQKVDLYESHQIEVKTYEISLDANGMYLRLRNVIYNLSDMEYTETTEEVELDSDIVDLYVMRP